MKNYFSFQTTIFNIIDVIILTNWFICHFKRLINYTQFESIIQFMSIDFMSKHLKHVAKCNIQLKFPTHLELRSLSASSAVISSGIRLSFSLSLASANSTSWMSRGGPSGIGGGRVDDSVGISGSFLWLYSSTSDNVGLKFKKGKNIFDKKADFTILVDFVGW